MFEGDRRLKEGLCRQDKPSPDERRGKAERARRGRFRCLAGSWLRL